MGIKMGTNIKKMYAKIRVGVQDSFGKDAGCIFVPKWTIISIETRSQNRCRKNIEINAKATLQLTKNE
jgi:hypothetical protein